ncbi:MAG: 5'-nucleotidase, lipoprotein e(P4) family [Thiothrix sp.]|nr:5'-nucleotidase, lipoprotein e(P4) family [Thiothrix sp.]HPE59458.1 5'-nucleotidase, lipoprotein e(P4) family [Thiolinea sp.]
MYQSRHYRLRHLVLALLMALTTGVTTVHAADNAADPAPETIAPGGTGVDNLLISAVAWKQTAAEYRALYYQGYNMARLQLEKALSAHKDGDKPLAVVTDLDDTVLLPLAYWGYLINHQQDFFDDAAWDQWIPKNQMVLAPGAAEFLKFAADSGVEVFYVSSRDQGEKTFEYALAQIREAGLPFADEAHVTILRDTSNKETRQQEIAEKYEIAVFLGDSLNDFQRKYYSKDVDERIRLMAEDRDQYGTRFIVFPNPTDGHWVRAIFGESEPPASEANREIFRKAATRNSWNGN